MESTERLYRSRTNKTFGGVSGGLANYFNIDIVLVRVAFVLLALFGGGGLLIYIVMWIVIPVEPIGTKPHSNNYNTSTDGKAYDDCEVIVDDDSGNNKPEKNSRSALMAGVILIFLGLLFLVDRLMPWYNITDFWPLILVVVGVILIKPDIFKSTKKENDEI